MSLIANTRHIHEVQNQNINRFQIEFILWKISVLMHIV